MSRLPQIKRLVKEDFPGLDWTEKLFFPLNQFMQAVFEALDKRLTFVENAVCQANEFEFTENAITYPLSFTWNRQQAPTDVIVTKVLVFDASAPTAAVFAHWNYDGVNVNITKFYGIDATKQVKIRVLAIGN